jgi:predicted Zn finger-like uncharacterized protein
MAIEFTCPACAGTLRIRDEAVGRLVRCGGCMTTLRVPEPAPAAFPGPEPTPAPPRPYAPAPVAAPASPPSDPQADETPAARGRSFWVLVTLGSLAFGAFACCGLAAVVLPGPEWREFDSAKGGYKVELPAAPKTPEELAKHLRGPRIPRNVEGTVLWTRAENYLIVFWDAAAEPGKTDDEILDAAVSDATRGPNVRDVVRKEPVVVSGCPGREFEFRQPKGGTYTGRVVLAGDRVFLLLAGGRFTRPGNENVRHFLDSFEVTDPKLLAAAKNRAGKAKQGKGPKPKAGD